MLEPIRLLLEDILKDRQSHHKKQRAEEQHIIEGGESTQQNRVHESQGLNVGQYQLGQKTTIVDCVSNRPVPCDLYSAYFLQDRDRMGVCGQVQLARLIKTSGRGNY
jgi:hypothetical protein